MPEARSSTARGLEHVLLVILLCGIAAVPLWEPGYFWGAHDARHDVYFIFEYMRSLDDGIWLSHWAPDFSFGYGYPFFLIYGPFTSFLGALLVRFAGVSYTGAVELLFAASMLTAGLGMYGFVRSWLGRNAGLVAAVAYVFLPYRLLEVYVRASLAEYVALAWLPLILWGTRAAFEASRPGDNRSVLWPLIGTALAYGGLMVTSNLVALIFTPFLGLYLLLLLLNRINEEQPLRQLSRESFFPLLANVLRIGMAPAVGLVLGLLISAFFWLPALAEGPLVSQEQWYGGYYDPEQHFVYPHQLFEPGWGFGISQPGPDDVQQGALGFQLGAVPLVLAVLALVAMARLQPALRRELRIFWLWLAVAIFLMLPFSAWLWQNVGPVTFAQFPWRWLMLTAVPLAILAGAVAVSGDDSSPSLTLPTLALVLLLLLGSYPYLQVETLLPTPQQGPVSYAALMRFQQSSNEMTGAPMWVDLSQRPLWSEMAELYVRADEPPLPPDATPAEQAAAIARQAAAVTSKVDYRQMPQSETLAVWSLSLGSAHEKLWVIAGEPGQKVVFNIAWFPGWRAYIMDGEDGPIVQEIPVEREDGPLARVVVPAPEGQHVVLLRFEDTPVRVLGQRVALLGWILLAAVAGFGIWFHIWRRPRTPQRGTTR